jgi:hypothetical protein
MIDVNQITSTLRGMPDQQLQQYAAMHKSDPYILSLAVSESNQRKKMRMAAQGQGGGQQMPKVADAAIAGMSQQQLPEDQGIAQIPAPNMQRMADGGIAGYGDDEGMAQGGMFDFAQRSEPVIRMSGGGHIPRYQGNTMDGSVVGGIPGFQAVQPRAEFTQQGAPENTPFFQRMFESLSSGNKERQLAMIAQKIAQGTATAEETAIYQAEIGKKSGQKQMGAPKDVVNPDEVLMATEKAGKFKTAADKVAADKAPSAAPAPQASLPTTGIASIAQAKKASDELYGTKALEGRIEQQRLQERQDIANEKTTREEKQAAFSEKQGPAMAGYAKLLDSEEKQDVSDKEKAGLMALFKGFLGIAAGESPNAITNIAKGSMVGLEDYSSALKDLKKSAKERNKERAYIENAQRAEGREDFKAQQSFEDKANDANRAADRAALDAITKVTGQKGEGATRIYSEMLQQQGANLRTNAQIAAGRGPGQTEHLYKTLGGGDVTKGLGVYAGIMGPEGKGVQTLLKEYSGLGGEAMLKSLEASKDPADKAKAATIRQLQREQLAGGLKPVNVANALP